MISSWTKVGFIYDVYISDMVMKGQKEHYMKTEKKLQ